MEPTKKFLQMVLDASYALQFAKPRRCICARKPRQAEKKKDRKVAHTDKKKQGKRKYYN